MNTATKVKRVAQALARVMTRSEDIQISISGNRAYRLPGLINVPSGDFSDPDVVTMTHGYIDHELGHENHTNHQRFVEIAQQSPTHKHFINMVEDVRMETCVGNEFSGAKGNLNKLAQLAINKELFAEPSSDFEPVKLVQMLVLYRGRYRVIGQDCLRDYASKAEVLVRDLLGDEFTDKACRLIDSISNAASTQDSGVIALELLALLEELQQDDEENDSGDSDNESSDNDEESEDDSESGDGDNDEDSDNEDSDQGSDSSESDETDNTDEDESSTESSDSSDNDGDDESDSNSNADSSNDDESDSSNDDTTETTDNSDSGASSKDDLQQVVQDILNASDDDGIDDIHELIAKELEDDATESDDVLGELAGSMPGPLPILKSPLLNNRFDEQKAKSVGKRVYQKLSRVLIDRDDSLQVHRTVGKRINARRLAGVSAGNNRLFCRRQEQPDNSAAISFVVDASGSMGRQMEHANAVAYAMCHGLSQSGIATEVSYFSPYEFADIQGVHIAKKFTEKHLNASRFYVKPCFGTPTGQAMLNAIPRLATRPESKKLLFVITDGDSDSVSEVIWSRQFAQHLGIKVIPIGLNTSFVHGFDRDEFKSVNAIEDLPKAINHAIAQKLFA